MCEAVKDMLYKGLHGLNPYFTKQFFSPKIFQGLKCCEFQPAIANESTQLCNACYHARTSSLHSHFTTALAPTLPTAFEAHQITAAAAVLAPSSWLAAITLTSSGWQCQSPPSQATWGP